MAYEKLYSFLLFGLLNVYYVSPRVESKVRNYSVQIRHLPPTTAAVMNVSILLSYYSLKWYFAFPQGLELVS